MLEPLFSRAHIVYFVHQYLGRTKADFPYSRVQMAQALDLLCRHPEPVEALEELDSVPVPEFPSFDCPESR